MQQPPVLQAIEINNNYEVENTQMEHQEKIVVFDTVEVYLKYFISLNCVLFSLEQKDRRICTATYFARELFYLLNQREFHCDFHDPGAVLIDSFCQKAIDVAVLRLVQICSSKYEFIVDHVLHFLHYSHVSFSMQYPGMMSNQLVERFFWKFVYI